jgi:hypothetical protein
MGNFGSNRAPGAGSDSYLAKATVDVKATLAQSLQPR